MYQSDQEIRLKVSVRYEDKKTQLQCPHDIVRVTQASNKSEKLPLNTVVVNSHGVATFQVTFKELSMDHSNQRFVLSAAVDESLPHDVKFLNSVASGTSIPFSIVRHKIAITEENDKPFIWYKDEGGREKTIELRVSVRDANNEVVTDRPVRLSTALHYSDGRPVQNQSILMISSDSQLTIGESAANLSDTGSAVVKGVAVIRYRVLEVSKTHQSQSFCLFVSGDVEYNPVLADIAPARSVAVEVKSKRNNPPKRAREMCGGMGSAPNVNVKRARQNPSSYMSSQMSAMQASPMAVADALSSMQQMEGWMKMVMQQLKSIEWQPVGYEAGSGDKGKLLYSMKNPNDVIADIAMRYNQILPCVEHVKQTLTTSGSSSNNNSPMIQDNFTNDIGDFFDFEQEPASASVPTSGDDLDMNKCFRSNSFLEVFPEYDQIGGVSTTDGLEQTLPFNDCGDFTDFLLNPDASVAEAKPAAVPTVSLVNFDDANIHHILEVKNTEKLVDNSAIELGCPAFDDIGRLIGFCRRLFANNSPQVNSLSYKIFKIRR